MSVLMLAQKQLYFTNNYITTITTPHIQALDKPLSSSNNMTLRRVIMGKSPDQIYTQRIFVSIDKSWKPGADHVATTPKKYVAQAARVLNNLIPECLHLYGKEAESWFTTTGLMVYKNVTWNDKTKSSSSSKSAEAEKLLNEMDIFGMGTTWIPETQSNPSETKRPENTTQEQPMIQAIIESRAKEDDVKSLGSIFHRNKDDDTTTSQNNKEEDSVQEVFPNTTITFDTNMVTDGEQKTNDDKSQ